MNPGDVAFLALYLAVLAGLSLYGAHRYHLAWLYTRHKGRPWVAPWVDPAAPVPFVTVQLPLYNERYVAERLLEATARIDWPRDRLEIQVLDDSTDNTVELVARTVSRLRALGHDIVHLRRPARSGFKAGALADGLRQARGELVAIFDADFVPPADFLRRTVPFFAEPGVGMVQARWDHINRDYSWLTQAQSVLLDGHFLVEHTARNRSGRFFNFNGTAGIWRRTAIDDAGGWDHDTLTEDLDLSYRAQLRGWRFIFLPDLVAPAEVPVDMNAFKAQQHRWAKGSIQVARKLLPTILRSPQPLRVKLEALVHLSGNLGYVLMTLLALMIPYALHLRALDQTPTFMFVDLPFFLGATVSVCVFYLLSQRELGRPRLARWLQLPVVLALGIGLALNNSRATLEALLGRPSPFVRTPKLGVQRRGDTLKGMAYGVRRHTLAFVEVGFGLVYTATVVEALRQGFWAAVPFLLLFQFGFLFAGLGSLFPATTSPRGAPATQEGAGAPDRGSIV
jgi:cellulose synthase/poly-beta-1,6-N-acetylglucosamine synthase-like glycosyltransferase